MKYTLLIYGEEDAWTALREGDRQADVKRGTG
jgi:hypothetical protein